MGLGKHCKWSLKVGVHHISFLQGSALRNLRARGSFKNICHFDEPWGAESIADKSHSSLRTATESSSGPVFQIENFFFSFLYSSLCLFLSHSIFRERRKSWEEFSVTKDFQLEFLLFRPQFVCRESNTISPEPRSLSHFFSWVNSSILSPLPLPRKAVWHEVKQILK